MHMKAMLVVGCLLVISFMAVFASPPAKAAAYIDDQLREERGATAILGGGEHVFVRFGTDAAFGIVYGTAATNANNIYVVAIKARYLGVAQVVDSQGRTILDNRAIKIYTVYAMKLDSIVEFRDGGIMNRVADYFRAYNATTGKFSNYYARPASGDTLYKRVDLNTNWTADPVVRTNGTGYRSWTFNLSAQNLSYRAVANYSGSVGGVLPLVRFTFHLNASLQQVTNVSVPQWKVTVGSGNAIANVTRLTDLLVSGKAVRYDLKWDQDIEGWTFEPANNGFNSRRLLLEVGAIVGNLIPAALADQWLENHVLGRMREAGVAQFNSTVGGASTANETTGIFGAVRRLSTPNVDFGGNWTRIGRYAWDGNSLVDGGNAPVFGQVVQGMRFSAVGENGNRFVGFVLLAGLSFRGGLSVMHDPSVTTDIQADLQLPPPATPSGVIFAVVGAVGVIVILLLITLLVARRRRRREELPPPPPPPPDE
jgi:hypothetical protein